MTADSCVLQLCLQNSGCHRWWCGRSCYVAPYSICCKDDGGKEIVLTASLLGFMLDLVIFLAPL